MKSEFAMFFTILLLATALYTACDGKADAPESAAQPGEAQSQRVSIAVTSGGYNPSVVQARAGEPLTLVFKRTSEEGCGDKVVFPDLDIRRALPLNEAVEIGITPEENETITFTCGMGMYKGSVVATTR